MQPVRVLVAGDLAMAYLTAVSMLEDAADIDVVGSTYCSDEKVIQICREQKIDVLILSVVNLNPMLLHLVKQIRKRASRTKVLILAVDCDGEWVQQMVTAGISGYLLQGGTGQELTADVHSVARGRTLFCEPALNAFKEEPIVIAENPLTSRQQEVLCLLAYGATDQQIALKMSIATCTVRYHLTHIFAKFNVDNRTEAVRIASENNWLNYHDPSSTSA